MNSIDLRIAYVLRVHKNPEQINMFIQQLLTDEQADIYIHIDKKFMDAVSARVIEHPRVIKIKENVTVTWGEMSAVDATIELLKAVAESGKKYHFVCLRTGQDLMVRKGYKEHLFQNKGKSLLSLREVDEKSETAALFRISWPKCTRNVYDSMHPYRILRVALRKFYGMGANLLPNKTEFDNSIRLFWGTEWFSISFDLAQYIVGYLDKNPWYRGAFRNSLAPSTMFFNTLAMNSPYAGDVAVETQTWLRLGNTYKTNSHPVVFTTLDIEEIENSGCFFARKFDTRIDSKVVDYFVSKITG